MRITKALLRQKKIELMAKINEIMEMSDQQLAETKLFTLSSLTAKDRKDQALIVLKCYIEDHILPSRLVD